VNIPLLDRIPKMYLMRTAAAMFCKTVLVVRHKIKSAILESLETFQIICGLRGRASKIFDMASHL
jgi:hypothetical protein